ncbi:hypothetical protein GCM10023074_38900 [Microbispora amethystogenes]|uniref:Resolvase/invertase-type recombinase catalytic domain-containing protein n=1 Tax=Microbispora amethystogenes TaxID=1427754 RepID=A0ABQ4FCL8_9ACTN|nr:hypothetical protein Mam01_27340 [Microbispora amethystogenes]
MRADMRAGRSGRAGRDVATGIVRLLRRLLSDIDVLFDNRQKQRDLVISG